MWDWIKNLWNKLFGGGGSSGPAFKEFVNVKGPFKGYGLVNNWSAQDPKKYMEACVTANVQMMAFEFFEWSTPEKFAAVDTLIKKFQVYVDLAKAKKMSLYVTILNSNIGSGKYGDPGIPSNAYTKQIYKAGDAIAKMMKTNPNIFVTPCGEGGAQKAMAAHDKKFQEYCKSIMPRAQMVNNWGARPTTTDGMGQLCQHPSSTKVATLNWTMSDHGLLIRELNGGDLYGTCKYSVTMPYSKKLGGKKISFIYYHFDKNGKIDIEALRALKDSQL